MKDHIKSMICIIIEVQIAQIFNFTEYLLTVLSMSRYSQDIILIEFLIKYLEIIYFSCEKNKSSYKLLIICTITNAFFF